MKNAFCKMCVTIYGRFRLNEGGVAGYVNRMKAKYTANWGVQVAGMIFQTRSRPLQKCTDHGYGITCYHGRDLEIAVLDYD